MKNALGALMNAIGGAGIALGCFILLPVLQTMSKPPEEDMMLRPAETTALPPPPPMEEPDQPDEPPPEEAKPELTEAPQPMDLSQLELALNPGGGSGWGTIDVGSLTTLKAETRPDAGTLFSLSDLDQKPRAVYQPSPIIPAAVRKNLPGSVSIIFVVDEEGRVTNPIVQKSSDPALEGPALSALKQWRFEPGRRSGKAVRFRMRVPITFPAG